MRVIGLDRLHPPISGAIALRYCCALTLTRQLTTHCDSVQKAGFARVQLDPHGAGCGVQHVDPECHLLGKDSRHCH
jgi:hypothetical protein